MADKAPEAEALAGRLIDRYRPVWSSVYSARRRLATIGVVVFTAWLFLHVTFGANGMVVYRQKRAEYQALQNANDTLRQENELYLQQIKSLKTDPQTIEKEAREQLHYTRPGEVVYVAPPPPGPVRSPANAAHK
jgi:cell division protein FtsB